MRKPKLACRPSAGSLNTVLNRPDMACPYSALKVPVINWSSPTMLGFTGIASPPITALVTDAPSTRYISSPDRPPRICRSPPNSVTPGNVFITSFTSVIAILAMRSPDTICFVDVNVFSIAGFSAVTETPAICTASVARAAFTGVVTSILTLTPSAV